MVLKEKQGESKEGAADFRWKESVQGGKRNIKAAQVSGDQDKLTYPKQEKV